MSTPVTCLAPIILASGKTEADLLKASEVFQKEFVDLQPGVLRRELVKTGEGKYMDIVKFRSPEDAADVMEKEKNSPVCHAFFAVMNLDQEMEMAEGEDPMPLYPSLATYSAQI